MPSESGHLAASQKISAFQSETQAVLAGIRPRDSFKVLYILTGLMALFFISAAITHVDRVVTGTGIILPTEGQIFVQPLQLSIVKEIKVHRGDFVHKGQVLALLDPTFANADLTQYQKHDTASHALVERLQAELDGRPYHPAAADSDGQLQLATYLQRMDEYRQGVADYDAKIASTKAVLAKAVEDAEVYHKQFVIAEKIRTMRSDLESTGYGSQLNTMMATNDAITAKREELESEHDATQARHDLAALVAERKVFISHWQDDLATQLAAAKRDFNDNQDSVVKAQKVSDLIELRAPKDAIVLDIGEISVGMVIDPTSTSTTTKPMFTLTPIGETLQAEVDIPATDVGFVEAGQKVTLKLDAYDFIRHNTVEGKLLSVSEGSFTTDTNGNPVPPYFKTRVRIEKVNLIKVPKDFRLVPGMTLIGDILAGRRTILSYLIDGPLRTSKEAMREPQ